MDKKEFWKSNGWLAFFAIVIFMFGFGLGVSKSGDINEAQQMKAVTQGGEQANSFDFDAFFSKNIDEIREVLGEPLDGDQTEPTAQQLELGVTEWTNTFEEENYTLMVTYDTASREILDFFIIPKK